MNALEYKALSFILENHVDYISKFRTYSKIYNLCDYNNFNSSFFNYRDKHDYVKNGSNILSTINFHKYPVGTFEYNLLVEAFNFYSEIKSLNSVFGCDVPSVIFRFNESLWNRHKRILERVNFLFNISGEQNPLYFLTFTFNNKNLPTSIKAMKQFRHKLTLRLNSTCTHFIANEDFGSQNDRFHYHSLVRLMSPDDLSVLIKKWKKFGYVYVEKITVFNDAALTEYTSKLVSHAIKVTNKRCCVIYSRTFQWSI